VTILHLQQLAGHGRLRNSLQVRVRRLYRGLHYGLRLREAQADRGIRMSRLQLGCVLARLFSIETMIGGNDLCHMRIGRITTERVGSGEPGSVRDTLQLRRLSFLRLSRASLNQW
jgi:hypothetical protein